MKHAAWIVIGTLALGAAPAFAQSGTVSQSEKAQAKVIADKLNSDLMQRISVFTKAIKGAPYSADTITESVQVLADGNRIVNRTTTKVYRDSEGRSRTDQVEPSGTQIVSITDPTAGAAYMLYPQTQTAVQNGAVMVSTVKTADGNVAFATTGSTVMYKQSAADKADAEKAAVAAGGGQKATFTYTVDGAGAGTYAVSLAPSKNVTREELGEQLIEGVMATGTRTTTVIDAGTIGNEQPIRIVSEEWVSKDLGILVMTKHSDPRTGETTYRVTNINRAEPDPSLFQVPADYKMQQSIIKKDGR